MSSITEITLQNGDLRVEYRDDRFWISLLNEGEWVPAGGGRGDFRYGFDVARHVRGWQRLTPTGTPPEQCQRCLCATLAVCERERTTDPATLTMHCSETLPGLYRPLESDTCPLYTRGYASAQLNTDGYIAQLSAANLTHEWSRGEHDARLDQMLGAGWVYTGRRGPDWPYESIEKVQSLF